VTLLAAAFSPYPVDVSINGFSGRMRRVIEELLEEPWDIVQVEHSYGLQSFLRVLERLDQPFVLTEHNVESTLVHTNNYHPRVPKALLTALHRFDLWRYRRWERRAFAAPRRLIAVTQPDADRMSSIGRRAVDVVANGADTESGAAVQPARDRPNIMFIGNFAYPPNQDAVEWAVAEIMPRIWHAIPAARFIVCGVSARPEWPTRWPDPRIEWRGFVPDVCAVQRESAVFLAPLRSGGGSKLKVLEAMAAGLPVVSTQEGVSGLAALPEQEYIPGEDADSLAAGVVELLSSPAELERIGEAGRRYVQTTHGWAALAENLEKVYQDAIASR
jgi:polysaccharide biosynthesis protein PslH